MNDWESRLNQGGRDWESELTTQGDFTGDRVPNPGEITVTRDEEKGAPTGTIAKSSFADEPAFKIQQYAARRFPDIPLDMAVKKYAVVNDEIVYRGDDGKYYSETPTMMDRIMSHVSKAIPMTAGTVAGVASAPLALTGPGGVAGAATITGLSAGYGESVRQRLGNYLTGDPVSTGEVGKEAALGVVGEGVGGLGARFMGRNTAKDIARMSADDVAQLQQLGMKYGIDLTPAELTQLPSLMARQKAIGNLPESSNLMDDFYRARAGQVDDAVEGELARMSPVDSAEIAGQQTADAATASIQGARAARTKAARPFYESTVTVDNIIPDDQLARLTTDPYLDGVIKQVKRDKLGDLTDAPDGSLAVLDAAKKKIDDAIEVAKRQGNRNKVRQLQNKKTKLLGITDDAFPDYPVARATFAGDSPAVDALEKGLVGILSKLKTTNAKSAAAKLFDPTSSGPLAVRQAKAALQKESPEAWQAVKRAWLQDQWERAGKEYATTSNTNRGGKFRALLFGDKKRKAILKEALEPGEYTRLEELSKVLDASGKVKRVGSDTAWNQEAQKLARDESRPITAKIARKLRVTSWLKNYEEWATEQNMRSIATRTAEIITSPNAMSSLKELSQVTPGSARAAVLLSHLFGIGGVEAMRLDQPAETVEQ